MSNLKVSIGEHIKRQDNSFKLFDFYLKMYIPKIVDKPFNKIVINLCIWSGTDF